MKYELEFVKISNEYKYAGVGFAGNVFITLNALTHISSDDKLIVNMEKQDCVCTERGSRLHNTENCWEYYFDQEKIESGEVVGHLTSLASANLMYQSKGRYVDPNEFSELKSRFYKSFKIKAYLANMLEDYYNTYMKNKITLGVQIRLTDMKYHHNVLPVTAYVRKIEDILSENPSIEQIFVATDDSVAISFLEDALSIPIIYHKDMFRANASNPHLNPYDRYQNNRPQHKYQLGVECMQEIFTLTKCDYLLKADVSAVSSVATILSENIKKVYEL